MTPQELMTLIEDCENRESRLSEWERGFIESVKGQLVKNNGLHKDQISKLEEIWEKVT